jgi:uncharacterized protein
MTEDKIEIRESNISGKGSFAKNPIKKGERICFMDGKLITVEEMINLVDCDKEQGSDPLGVDDEMYIDMDELYRSINHSCKPNAYLRGRNELVASRDIDKDEEIFYDYSTTMDDNKEKIEVGGGELWDMECKCGNDNCRRIISQFKTLPKKLQRYYLRNSYAPDFILRNYDYVLKV